MDSVATDDDEDFGSDDDFDDPDYLPDEIRPEHQLNEANEFFVQAVSLSVNLSATSSELLSTSRGLPRFCDTFGGASTCAASSSAVTGTKPQSGWKPQKRSRSPLPSLEESGPSITPSAGDFIGSGM